MFFWLLFALAGVAALAHFAPFPFLIDAAGRKTGIWRMPETPGRKIIYLSYDDGPNPSVTPALLDLLEEKKVRATFFLIDEHVTESTAPIVRRMFEEGHDVGVHSGDRWLMLSSPDALANRIRRAAARIEKAGGRKPCPLFRPHAGWRSPAMLRGLSRVSYRLAGWSWLTWDWVWFRKRTGARVAAQILAHAAPGKIVVIHDGHHKNPAADRAYAIDATRRIIEGLRARSYEFGTLCSEWARAVRISDRPGDPSRLFSSCTDCAPSP